MKFRAAILLLPLLFVASRVLPAQGAETQAPLPAADKRAVPATPGDVRRLVALLEADRAALDLVQRDNPSQARGRTIQILEEEIEALKRIEARRQDLAGETNRLDRATTEIEELRKRLVQSGQDDEALPDPADPKAETSLAREKQSTEDLIREELKRRDDASESREKLRLEQERVLRRLPAAKRDLSEAQADLTDYETDSREALAGGIPPDQGRAMNEQVFLYRLRVAEHQALVEVLKFSAGEVGETLIDRASLQVALAEENLRRLEERRATIDVLAERASQSRVERGRAEEAAMARAASEAAPWARPYWEFKQRLAAIEVEIAATAKARRSLEARLEGTGEIAVLKGDAAAESRGFARVDERKAELEDVVPGTTRALLQLIARREAELGRIEALQEELRAERKDLREKMRLARADDAGSILDEVDAARKRAAPPGGAEPATPAEREAASASAWEKLRNGVKAAVAARATLFAEYDKLLTDAGGDLFATKSIREQSLLRYRSALIWTRDPSEISGESLARVRADLASAPEAVLGAVTGAARSSWGWASDSARSGRIADLAKVLGAVLGAGLLIWFVHRRAAKAFAAPSGDGGRALTVRSATRLAGTVLRRISGTALLAFGGVVIPALAGAPRQTVLVCAAIFTAPLAFHLARTLIDLLFGSGPGERGILGLPEALARLFKTTCVMLTRVCVCFVPLALLLTVTGYRDRNPGFVELLWLLNSIGCYLVVLGVLLRPSGLAMVLRRGAGPAGRASFVHTVFAAVYPVLIAAVLFLLVLRSLSYRVAVRFFLDRFLISAAWIGGAFVLRRWFAKRLFGNEPRLTTPPADHASDSQKFEAEGRRALFDRLRRLALTLVVFGPAVFFVLDAWGLTGAGWDAVFSRPVRPLSETLTPGDILAALVTALVAFFVVRSARDLLRFVILPRTSLDTGVRYTIVTLTTYALVALSAVVILGGQLKVDPAVIGGFVAALGLGLGFGLQEIINNFFSGIILLVERPLKVGDSVTIGETSGRVDRINMRSTTIVTGDNHGVIVPNKELISSTVTNWSSGAPIVRDAIPLGIAYGSDTSQFRKVVMDAVEAHGLVLKNPAPELVFTTFGASSLEFVLRYWVRRSASRGQVKSDLFFALDAAFRRHGIEMPFPQQDIHVRSWDANAMPRMPGASGDGGTVPLRESETGAGG